MKKAILFLLFLFIFFDCKKEDDNLNNVEDNSNIEKPKIDFEAMKSLIDNSVEIDIEVFFAISVYHKYYISRFHEEAAGLNEDEQKVFYLKKKDEFFKSIKYSEAEYNNFMEKNINSMNEYISSHPEISEFLISTN